MTKNQLREFIEGEEKEIKVEMMSLDYYKDLLQESGFEHLIGEGETNGWQVDFWEYFKSEKYGKLQLSGSLWYGGFKLEKV